MLDIKKLTARLLNWTKAPLKTYYVSVQLGKAYGSHVQLTAPTVPGYTFVCWLTSSSIGWICNTYINEAEQSLWNGNTGASGTDTGTVRVYALYVKTSA